MTIMDRCEVSHSLKLPLWHSYESLKLSKQPHYLNRNMPSLMHKKVIGAPPSAPPFQTLMSYIRPGGPLDEFVK